MLLLLHQVSLLVGVGSSQLVHHGQLVVLRHLLRVLGTYGLLTLTSTHTCRRLIGLLRLPQLLHLLSVQEIAGVLRHELVGETVLHAELLIGLVEVLLGSLLLHVGRMMLLLLL